MKQLSVIFFLLIQSLIANEQLDDLISKIQSDEFQVREAAREELKKLMTNGKNLALQQLLEISINSKSPEVKATIRKLITPLLGKSYLGIGHSLKNIKVGQERIYGIQVTAVYPNTPAQKAGLLPLDIITKVGGKDFNSLAKKLFKNSPIDVNQREHNSLADSLTQQFQDIIRKSPHGKSIELVCFRGNKYITLKASLQPLKDNPWDARIEKKDNNGFGVSQVEAYNQLYNDAKKQLEENVE